MSSDPFWQGIDAQLDRIISEKPQTFKALNEIIPGAPSLSAAPAFFAGSGGDRTVMSALGRAGWKLGSMEASYYYTMVSPTGEKITYIEGDIYPGDKIDKDS